jgi:SPOR domain
LADNTFRSLRGRQAPAPERTSAGDANDPLAELARLIGQSDPYAERQAGARERGPAVETDSPAHEWADEDEVEQEYAAEGRYAQPPSMPRAVPLRDYAPRRDEGEYEHEPQADDQYFSSASGYPDEREDSPQDRQSAAGRPVPAFLTSGPSEDSAEFAEPEHDTGHAYAHEEYYQPSQQRRRGGLVVVMAVLGLAVVGTAGAFAYRTMFGGSLLPALPPIIKANTSPNKVMPNSGDAQAANSGQGGAVGTSAGENVVSREEEPINIDQPKPAPRIISTIPVSSNSQTAALPPSVVASVTPMPGSSAPGGAPASVPSAGPDWPSSPAIAAPVAAAPAQPGNAAAAPSGPPPEPKKIHTVSIRPEQADGRTTARGGAARAAAPADGNAPLALVPGGGDAATAGQPRSRRSQQPTAVASNNTASTGASEIAPAGGYHVQVSSQHSETEAQSSFQALRAKYPDLLGKREPIIRRADLGAKGVYYRALVGPFASAEEAASMCSSLKAAGGKCIVQRN